MQNYNKYQSSIEELKIDTLPQEVQDQYWDFTSSVPNIRNYIDPKRPYAKDLERDSEGKIIIDITKPHILENMDYFRPAALHFKEFGCYTKLRPNPNPNSEFGKWITQETRRCIYGYVRESDGEWITGDYYFFLNYSPMLIIRENNEGIDERVIDFPDVWDTHYYKFHYLYQARKNKNHALELASRGRGKSFCAASMLAKRFVLGESKTATKKVTSYIVAHDKAKLIGGDQTLNKFLYDIDHIAKYMQWAHKRVINTLQGMEWQMGYKNIDTGTVEGSQNAVVGKSLEDESKLRGTRGVLYLFEEGGCHLKGTKVLMYDGTQKNVEDIIVGDTLMGDDSTPRKVLETHSGVDDMYKITLKNGEYQIVNSKHIVPYNFYKYNSAYHDTYIEQQELDVVSLSKKNLDNRYTIRKAVLEFPHKDVKIDPYLLGLWLGNENSEDPSIVNEDSEVLDWLKNNYNCSFYYLKQSKKCYSVYIKNIRNTLSEYNLLNNKHIPEDYKINDKETVLKLLAGFIDTDGYLDRRKHQFEICQLHTGLHILQDLKWMCESIGFKCSLTKRILGKKSKWTGHLNYILRISGNTWEIPTKIKRKQDTIRSGYRNKLYWNDYTFKIEPYGRGEYYGFTVDGNHLFTLGDLTITHNSFPNLIQSYLNLLPSVQDNKRVYGMLYVYGTTGDDTSDFASMQEIMYNPKGYNAYGIPNVYDKEGLGRPVFTLFSPAYLNAAGRYDKDGNSNVTGALVDILMNRFTVKYNSTDTNAITKTVAELPITPQEAILRVNNNIFPVTEINQRIAEIDSDPRFYDDTYVGTLVQSSSGEMTFYPTDDTPIRDFPTKTNKVKGALEIYEMPIYVNGKVPYNRYILSLDNYENDVAATMSLGSIFVLDTWTDRIVAEYTGRPEYLDDLNEMVRKMCIFYNGKCLYESNKKSSYAYFQKMGCLHYLADTPDWLKQRELVKSGGFGNTSKGVNATTVIKKEGFGLIRDWLLKPVTNIQIIDGEEQQVTGYNLHHIKNRALLRELSLYTPDTNVDRIMSLCQLMLYREEIMITAQNVVGQKAGTSKASTDPFFSRYENALKNH